jgi:hypothetical protein
MDGSAVRDSRVALAASVGGIARVAADRSGITWTRGRDSPGYVFADGVTRVIELTERGETDAARLADLFTVERQDE